MNTSIKEQLSALMDGELSESETHQLIGTLQNDAELKKIWESYHLISAAIHHNLPDKLEQNVARNVISTLATEPTVLAPRGVKLESKLRTHTPFFRQIAGLAVAASVTAVAILSVQTVPQDPLTGNVQVAISQPAGPAAGVNAAQVAALPTVVPPSAAENAFVSVSSGSTFQFDSPSADQQWDLGEPAFEAKLNSYLDNHSQYSVPADMQGVIPQARMIGYGQE